jgi:hypothetical protein
MSFARFAFQVCSIDHSAARSQTKADYLLHSLRIRKPSQMIDTVVPSEVILQLFNGRGRRFIEMESDVHRLICEPTQPQTQLGAGP